MAESILFDIAGKTLERLSSLVLQEFFLAWGVKSELEKLEGTLSTIKSVLLDAEEKAANNRELSVWLGKLKDICYDADDVLDEFEYEALRLVVNRGSIKRKVRNLFSCSSPIAFPFRMGYKIKEIRERLNAIVADKDNFRLTEQVVDRRVMHRKREMTHSFVHTSDVIGRDDDKEKIVQLLKRSDVNEKVSIIPIVGIGGLGKTSLAKLVYNDERVAGHFDLTVWVYVSEDFDVRKIIENIIKVATKTTNCDNLIMERLQTLLRDTLRNKVFLLILDDVWNEDYEKWTELRELLMEGANGSKIVVTTRNQSVASVMRTISFYELKGLSDDDCLSLFLKYAFREGQEKQYPNLVKIGKEIVEKCKGVPLAVRTLGSILYSKTDERDWLFVRDNDIWKLKQEETGILPVLRFSYNQMPSHLKRCFSYCAIFPKGHKIVSIVLIQLWMAQGLIQPLGQNTNQKLEDIGKQYVNELWSRSFFQDVEEGYGSSIASCKMHDLIHDLALSISQTECSIITSCTQNNIPRKVKHVSFLDFDLKGEEVSGPLLKLNNVRTIFSPLYAVGPTSNSFLNACIPRFKHLRVLDLSDSSIEVLPNSIGNLKHLRHLDLSRNERIKSLPNSICKLHSLQTLQTWGCYQLEGLPRDIGNLIMLEHLELTTKQQRWLAEKRRGGSFTALRTLVIYRCENLVTMSEEGMKGLVALRILFIYGCPRLTSLEGTVKYLIALENLCIWDCPQLNLMDENVDIESLKRLRCLLIAELPQLLALPQWLQGAANTLQFLRILRCDNLATLPEWPRHFKSLQELEVEGCPKLTSLPDEWFHGLTALRKLHITWCGELSIRLKFKTKEEWPKIAHVSEINIDRVKIKSANN